MLAPELKDFLARLKPITAFEWAEAKCVACHASPTDPLYRYLPKTAPVTLWKSELFAVHQPDFLFLGPTHLPMKAHFRRTPVVKPGSVGHAKHGDPRAAYGVWENGEVTLRREEYDVEETIRGYADRGVEPHILNLLTQVLRIGGELSSERFQLLPEKTHHGQT